MKTIFVYATADKAKRGEFYRYNYVPFRHPVAEWANIFEADSLGGGFDVGSKHLNWDNYDLAIVFDHDVSIGSVKLIREKVGRQIKIVMIPEPPPQYLLSRTSFGLLNKLQDDFNHADLVLLAHECYLDDWRGRFRSNNIHFCPVPINIVEYEKRLDLDDRKNIIASTGHCNFAESSRRSWKVIAKSLPRLHAHHYRTRCFYSYDIVELRALQTGYDEACGFIWDTNAHIKRLNECKIIVDDNICPASGHITLETMCLGIPSVGSNDFITHLFPELGLTPNIISNSPFRPKSEVGLLSAILTKLATDDTYYKQMVKKGMENLHKWYSYESCKKRLLELLGSVS